MADYDAKIRVSADTRSAEQAIQSLETKVNSLVNGLDIGKKVGRSFAEAFVPPKQLKQLDTELATIASRADTVAKRFARVIEGVGTIGVAAKGVSDVSTVLQQLSVSAQNVAANFNNANAVARTLTPGFNAAKDAANLLSKTIGTLEYKFSALVPSAQGIVDALGAIGPQAGLAAGAVATLGTVFETVLRGRAKQLENDVSAVLKTINDQTQQLLRTLESLNIPIGGTVRQFQALLRTGEERLANVSSYSDEARRAINTILTAEIRLTAELERQAVLRREMEASRFAAVAQRTGMQFTFGGPKALPMVGQTAFQGELRGGLGGGARTLIPSRTEMLVNAAGGLASRSGIEARATTASLQFSAGLSNDLDKVRALVEGEQEITKAVNARLLPAFNEQRIKDGTVKLLNNEVKESESLNRIEQALNGNRARGARYVEKLAAEEKRLADLGIARRNNGIFVTGVQKTNRLPNQISSASFVTPGPAPLGSAFPTAGPVPLDVFAQRRLAAQEQAQAARGLRAQRVGKTLTGAASNAAVGGAFPLLFGQSGTAAAGGAIGGILGSVIPGIGGFGGSLIGTIIGEKVGQGNKVKELAADIGFSAEQTKLLGTAFKQAGQEFDKFQQAVQNIRGLSLSIDDQAKAIQLVSALTENYGGQIDKVTNALTSSLETGKVSQATLNQLTSQGIPIQQALADKYGVSRDAILKLAKDGKISTQDLIDTLVDLGNKGPEAVTKNTDAFAKFIEAAKNLGSSIATLGSNIVTALTPAFNFLVSQLTKVFNLAVAGLDAINAQFAAGRAGALNRQITGAKIAGQGFGLPFLRNPSESLDQVSKGIAQLTPQKNKAGIQQNLNAIQQYANLVQTVGSQNKDIGNIGKRAENLQGILLKLRGQNIEALKAIPTASSLLKSFTAPSQAAPTAGGGGSDKAAKDAARLAEQIREQLKASEKELEVSKVKLQIAQALDPLSKNDLQYRLDKLRIEQNFNAQIEDAKSAQAKLNFNQIKANELEELRLLYLEKQTAELLKQAGITEPGFGTKPTGIDFAQGAGVNLTLPTPLTEQIDKVKEELTALLDPINQVTAAATAIGDAFATSFKGLVDGSQTAQQALAGFFQNVANYFLDAAAKIIAKWIELTILNSVLALFPTGFKAPTTTGVGTNFSPAIGNDTGIPFLSGIGKRAAGGPVAAGTPYIVGEKGPELFMPRNSGTIIPNNAMGGGSTNVVVNVDASGSSVQGDQQQARQLGLAVSAAVQAELVKQQRPGGLLAGTRR